MLELPGQPALSDFRLAKLQHALQQFEPRVKAVAARYCYFIAENSMVAIGKEHRKRLNALLLSGEKAGTLGKAAQTLYVLPRPGTISPWSSKATDIARACKLDSVQRIERGICYGLHFKAAISDDELAALGTLLHDRMTETVFTSGDAAAALFASARSCADDYRCCAARWQEGADEGER